MIVSRSRTMCWPWDSIRHCGSMMIPKSKPAGDLVKIADQGNIRNP
jgi:hypothetical protein